MLGFLVDYEKGRRMRKSGYGAELPIGGARKGSGPTVVGELLQRVHAFTAALMDGQSEDEIVVQRYAELKAETPTSSQDEKARPWPSTARCWARSSPSCAAAPPSSRPGRGRRACDDHMTARRVLGSGPQGPSHAIHAREADLSEVLPGVRVPDLDELRERGVLQARTVTSSSARRVPGNGGRSEALPDPPADSLPRGVRAAGRGASSPGCHTT